MECNAQGSATAQETAYPWSLSRKIAQLIAVHLQQQGVQCPTPSSANMLHTWIAAFVSKPMCNPPPPDCHGSVNLATSCRFLHRIHCQRIFVSSALPQWGHPECRNKGHRSLSQPKNLSRQPLQLDTLELHRMKCRAYVRCCAILCESFSFASCPTQI